mmetsp:Transcript_3401/g.5810  ORF Transcript_3401/g.5810 Transcript_3401/m.5810 type:complete len:208 (+) Transcript_3401:5913-6536(+)
MSFLPPVGCDMALTYCKSTRFLNSPGLSRLYKPFISKTCRTISLVIWSPHSLMSGMLRSSMNKHIFMFRLGPYVVPIRFSMTSSTTFCSSPGVVAEEKFDFFHVKRSFSGRAAQPVRNCSMVTVLAVPEPPMSRTARFWTKLHSMRYSSRAESSVEMNRVENSSLSSPGYFQGGMDRFQCTQLPVFRSTRYSKIVSSEGRSSTYCRR